MKKCISIVLVLTMILTMCACGAKKEVESSETAATEDASSDIANSDTSSSVVVSSESETPEVTSDMGNSDTEQTQVSTEEKTVFNVGVLTMLNMTEDEMGKYRKTWKYVEPILGKEGYLERNIEPFTGKRVITYYDTLDSMLMALDTGDIDEMMIYYKTGQYLCATNNNLELAYTINFEKERNTFAQSVLSGNMSNDFAFLMMEGNVSLRDEFNNAINDMKADGTMDKLISEQIDALINGGDIKAVPMPTIDGADTIKVAVTGALPPMDYVAADGLPAGFNTAVLAEISQRIEKNIEIVVVDSVGRATALSSGTVDAVFWVRTNERYSYYKEMSDEEKEAKLEDRNSQMNEEEIEAINQAIELLDFEKYALADIPEGTICTTPYYEDFLVMVMKQ